MTRPEDDEMGADDAPEDEEWDAEDATDEEELGKAAPIEDEEETTKLEEFEDRMEEWEHKPRSPKAMKQKGMVSAILAFAWIGFVIIWLFFFATEYTFFESAGVILASLFILLGMTNAVMWGPPEWRVRLSSILGIGWVTFIVLWLPFYRNFGIPLYQGYAILILSFVVLSLVLGGSWLTIVPRSGWKPSRMRVGVATVIFYGWLGFLILWLWSYAAPYTHYQNGAVVLISTLIGFLLIMATVSSEIPSGPTHRWAGTGIAIAWFVIMSLWLWFFAGAFELPQNLAVVLLITLVLGALGGFHGRTWISELESFDWED
ncbi:hypothetical protein EU522_00825 [Candidatus Thorarchaeota archaeon]|nr:MAG: hypothetical protein EU522_00825 [Candidatus Thorarchaeota archaeon]